MAISFYDCVALAEKRALSKAVAISFILTRGQNPVAISCPLRIFMSMLNKAIIDLNAIRQNALSVKKLLPQKTKLCAVVKADAYGHGAEKVANALYPIADCFAVALVEEAVALRLSGIDKEILVLNRPMGTTDADTIARYDLTATVYKVSDVIMLNEAAKKEDTAVRVHVKINTGMNRQGVDDSEKLKSL